MRIPDRIRKCVAYLCAQTQENVFRPGGTGVFIGVRYEDLVSSYLVTAKHVIEDIAKDSIDGNVYLRANTNSGTSKLLRSSPDDWLTHPTDETVDAAVVPFSPFAREFDHRVLSTSSIITQAGFEDENVGIGDEVFIIGLFTRHHGNAKNIPIVRVGNLAALPEETVATRYGETKVYLIECRSIGGLSGSPVFVHHPILRYENDEMWIDSGWFRLFGIIHGHWDTKVVKKQSDISLFHTIQGEAVNMGIAIVTPIEKVMEVINQPKLEEQLKREIVRMRQENLPTKDGEENED